MNWKFGSVLALLLLSGLGLWSQTLLIQEKAWAGDSVAMLSLSEAFRFGKGVSKNEDSARIYIKKSAEKGHREAQFLYGTELMIDVFNAKTYEKGINYLKKAATNGHVDAQYRLAETYATKGRDNVSDNYYDLKVAYKYAEMAAAQNLPEALYYCADARLSQKGTTKNDSIAFAYFSRAGIDQKYVPAMIRMGHLYWDGKVTGKPEPFLAMDWFYKALNAPYSNLDQRGQANEGLYLIDQFFKKVQNTYIDASPIAPFGMYDYRLR